MVCVAATDPTRLVGVVLTSACITKHKHTPRSQSTACHSCMLPARCCGFLLSPWHHRLEHGCDTCAADNDTRDCHALLVNGMLNQQCSTTAAGQHPGKLPIGVVTCRSAGCISCCRSVISSFRADRWADDTTAELGCVTNPSRAASPASTTHRQLVSQTD
jgi:hypothetical protein